jgi:hypothetical protein
MQGSPSSGETTARLCPWRLKINSDTRCAAAYLAHKLGAASGAGKASMTRILGARAITSSMAESENAQLPTTLRPLFLFSVRVKASRSNRLCANKNTPVGVRSRLNSAVSKQAPQVRSAVALTLLETENPKRAVAEQKPTDCGFLF